MNQAAEFSGVVIGVDVGGTKTHAASFDRHFNVIADLKVPTLTGGVDQVGTGIVEAVATLQSNGRPLTGVGIGLPGIVDSSAGSVRHAFNLGIGDDALDIVSRLNATLGVPCWIANDVNAAALGVYEILRRDHRGLRDLVYLSIGTGIAAGVILDGRIYRGQNGFAGDIGHFLRRSRRTAMRMRAAGLSRGGGVGDGPLPPMACGGPALIGGGAIRRRRPRRRPKRRLILQPGRRAPRPAPSIFLPLTFDVDPHRDRRWRRRRRRLAAHGRPQNKACTDSRVGLPWTLALNLP